MGAFSLAIGGATCGMVSDATCIGTGAILSPAASAGSLIRRPAKSIAEDAAVGVATVIGPKLCATALIGAAGTLIPVVLVTALPMAWVFARARAAAARALSLVAGAVETGRLSVVVWVTVIC